MYSDATYVHCRSHVLNLANFQWIQKCTTHSQFNQIYDNDGKLTGFLSGSARRKKIFLKIAAWWVRTKSCLNFWPRLKQITKNWQNLWKQCQNFALEYRLFLLRWQSTTQPRIQWRRFERLLGETKSDVGSYIRLSCEPYFIVALTVALVILSFLGPMTKSLQAKEMHQKY